MTTGSDKITGKERERKLFIMDFLGLLRLRYLLIQGFLPALNCRDRYDKEKKRERERERNMNIFFHDSSIDLNIAGKLDVAFRGAACSYGKDIA